MRSKIPPRIREELMDDPFMTYCVIAHECEGRIEWHHAFFYAGKRINEPWSIVSLCHKHHYEMKKSTKAICDMNMRMRIRHFNAEESFKEKYPRSTLLTTTP
jgi:hypothetical protein